MSFDLTYPLVTSDLPGVAGVYKQHFDDFIVEEVPLYTPAGEGEHLYLWVEKVDVSAAFLKRQLQTHLGVNKRDVGMAGMKDRAARTRQWVSVPASDVNVPLEDIVGPLTPQIEVLASGLHKNKLKMGHLKGNLFELVIRQLPDLPSEALRLRMEDKCLQLMASGMPNYYGPQRFGHDGHTLRLGLGFLANDKEAKNTLRRNKSLKQLALNAVQSAHFNETLKLRMQHDLWSTICEGDVMKMVDGNSLFVVDAQSLEETQARFDQQEVCWTGPMMGRKTMRASGVMAQLEEEAAEALGLTPRLAQQLRGQLPGTRRPALIWPQNLSWCLDDSGDEPFLRVKFFLPSGSYATILCEEFFCSTPT